MLQQTTQTFPLLCSGMQGKSLITLQCNNPQGALCFSKRRFLFFLIFYRCSFGLSENLGLGVLFCVLLHMHVCFFVVFFVCVCSYFCVLCIRLCVCVYMCLRVRIFMSTLCTLRCDIAYTCRHIHVSVTVCVSVFMKPTRYGVLVKRVQLKTLMARTIPNITNHSVRREPLKYSLCLWKWPCIALSLLRPSTLLRSFSIGGFSFILTITAGVIMVKIKIWLMMIVKPYHHC